MQRKATKNTRGPNADEKRFQAWCKEQPCVVTELDGPSIVHHCEGATFKHNKVLIGHWFCIPLSLKADNIVTHRSRHAFRKEFGAQSDLWLKTLYNYESYSGCAPPEEVKEAIMDWNK